MRDKLAEFLIMVAIEWVATPDYRKWWHANA